MTDASMIAGLASGLLSGKVKVVDLTAPLGPDTPVLYLPPQFGKNTPNVKVHTISAYDQDGPFWAGTGWSLANIPAPILTRRAIGLPARTMPKTRPTPFPRRTSSRRSMSSTAQRKRLKTRITC